MFNLPNLLTAGNLMSGILAILLALSGWLDLAPFAILLGLFFDFLDGFAARLLKVSGSLGKQLDSLADMVTFGVAPGIIMMCVFLVDIDDLAVMTHMYNHLEVSMWINATFSGSGSNYLPLVGLIFPVFSLFRLAKFNIDTRQSDSFIGLPTPAATLLLMTFPLALGYALPTGEILAPIYHWIFNPWVIALLILIVSILMVVEPPLFALKFKHFKLKGNEIRYAFLLISLILILVFKVWSIALIVFLYLILSLVENTFFKKNKNEV